MAKINKKTKFIFFSGLIYSFLITAVAYVFYRLGYGLFPYAARELVFVAAEVLSLAAIFAFFMEIFIKRFER